ncbi:MAG: hypothetical protein IPK64_17020 [bacterium]|nr:hypothetical protein [bacterium]
MIAAVFAPYQWRAQWRDLRQRGAWRGSNVATVIVLGIVGSMAQAGLSAAALAAIAAGDQATGLALAEAGLTGVLIAWIMLPVLVHSIAGGGAGVILQRLTQFPLSTPQVFTVGMVGTLIQPIYWVLILTSLLALAPLALAPRAGLALVAGLLYVVAVAVLSWAIGLAVGAVMSSRRGREIALTITAVLVFGFIPLLFGDFEHDGGQITFTLAKYEVVLLAPDAQSGLLLDVGRWMPAARIGAAARGEGAGWTLLALAAATAIGLCLSLVSLRRLITQPAQSLGSVRSRTSAITGLPGLPAVLGVPAMKEVRYLLRTLDALLAFAFAVIAAIWILIRPDDARLVLILCLPIIVLNEMVMPLNVFGLDGKAVDRYRLLPLSGAQVVLGKNIAFVLVLLLEFALPVLAGAWRAGVVFTTSALCAALAAVCLMMAWGNQVSVRSPAPRAFFNFDSKEQAGGILSMLGTILLWLVPFLLGLLARELGGHAALLAAEFLLLVAAASLYAATLPSAGRAFDARAEEMRARLAGQG